MKLRVIEFLKDFRNNCNAAISFYKFDLIMFIMQQLNSSFLIKLYVIEFFKVSSIICNAVISFHKFDSFNTVYEVKM